MEGSKLKLLPKLLCTIMLLAISGMVYADERYHCYLDSSKSNGWIPTEVLLTFGSDKTVRRVTTNITSAPEFDLDYVKLIRWNENFREIKYSKQRRLSNGKTYHFDHVITILVKHNKAVYKMSIRGYQESLEARGQCKRLSSLNPMLQPNESASNRSTKLDKSSTDFYEQALKCQTDIELTVGKLRNSDPILGVLLMGGVVEDSTYAWARSQKDKSLESIVRQNVKRFRRDYNSLIKPEHYALIKEWVSTLGYCMEAFNPSKENLSYGIQAMQALKKSSTLSIVTYREVDLVVNKIDLLFGSLLIPKKGDPLYEQKSDIFAAEMTARSAKLNKQGNVFITFLSTR